MANENVKVCGGILLTRSESGTSKIQKVLVETKPGKTKGRVKCRLQRFVENTFRPSKIPVLIKNHRTKKSLHSSIVNFSESSVGKNEDSLIDPSSKGDWKTHKKSRQDVPDQKNLQMEGPHLNSKCKKEPKEAISSKDPSNLGLRSMKTVDLKKKQKPEASLRNEERVPHLNMADSAVDLLYETENKDSTIHVDEEDDDFEDDDDECLSLTKFQEYNIQKSENPTIVMAQYSTILHKPHEGGEHSEPESEEDFEVIEPSVDSNVDSDRRYIDSGLRRLKSQESRLFLDNFTYKSKRKPPTEGEDDGVQPLLEELPSDIFRPPRTPIKRPSSRSIKAPVSLSQGDSESDGSLEDEESKTPSEASDIDTGPLDKLKELEDKSYVISTGELINEEEETSRHGGLSRPSRLDRYSGLAVRDRSFEDKDLSRRSSLIRARDKDTSRLSGFSTPSVPLPVRIRSRDSGRFRGRSLSGERDVSAPLIQSVGPSTLSLDQDISRPLPLKIRSLSRHSDLGERDVSVPLIDSFGPSTESLIQEIGRHGGIFPVIGKLSKLVETPSKDDFCIHTKDVPDEDFSSTSFRPQKPRKPFKSRDDEFCVHIRDPPRSGRYSSSDFHHLGRKSQYSRSSSHRDRSSIRTIHPSKSQGFSTVSLIDNKEARRSKYSKTKKSSKNW